MYEIVIGRSEADRKKFGMKGALLLGKHYIKMGQTTSLSNKIYLDIARAHVVYITGKRGSGKSYTLGVIAEGLADMEPEVQQNLSIILLDTMGIYWTMKYPNKKDDELLDQWGLKAKGLPVQIYTPIDYYKEYKDKGIPTDHPFSINPAELSPNDWYMSFDIKRSDSSGVLIERIITNMRKESESFSIEDIIKRVRDDDRSEQKVRDAVENRFLAAKEWGLFSEKGTPLKELAKGGQITVLDVSCYATTPGGGWVIKSLVVGLIAQKLFIERMIARKNEEYQQIHETTHYFSEKTETKLSMPLVWLVIDEAHEFLPRDGVTTATGPLVTILREGRQPGISLILATQQPAKIHTDVMTQADTLISHRITSKMDTDALGSMVQSYMRGGLINFMNDLPRVKGAAVILDDTNERMYPMRIRPRFTWHGGESPMAVKPKKEEL